MVFELDTHILHFVVDEEHSLLKGDKHWVKGKKRKYSSKEQNNQSSIEQTRHLVLNLKEILIFFHV